MFKTAKKNGKYVLVTRGPLEMAKTIMKIRKYTLKNWIKHAGAEERL